VPIESHEKVIPVKRPSIFQKKSFLSLNAGAFIIPSYKPIYPPGSTRNSTRQKVSICKANSGLFLNDWKVVQKKTSPEGEVFRV
jgi:hypothetical protein